ncbi:MAG: ABC transporter permease subunit [Anaerolineae bacterium]|nr:ABC transporter permease subunit [Anaerolineae bacterium]MDW8173509.1 ABC transporter permease subunit [Anaerolineae bacterium]
MFGLTTIASPQGFFIGALCGLVPLGAGLYYRQWRAGVGGFLACLLSGFACGFLGGLPTILMSYAVVLSYAYVNRQDPFTSRAALEEVNFEETRVEQLQRQLANLGRGIRTSWRALTRNRAGFLGFLGIMFFVVVTVFGPLFIEYEGAARLDRRQPGARSLIAPPSYEHPLGLDWKGRDVLSHMVHGGQRLILTSIQAGLIATVIAVVLGSLAALLGGVVDSLISNAANFILTIPSFPLLLVLASLVNLDSDFLLALLFGVLNWPTLMRAVRAQVFSLRERDYVEAAVALDLGVWHIISREVFPNMISYIAVNLIFTIRVAMYSIVGLVFLGLVPLSEPDWGVMIFTGRQQGVLFQPQAAGMLLAPIVAIALFQLSLVLFTRSLEEVFNPRLRSGL